MYFNLKIFFILQGWGIFKFFIEKLKLFFEYQKLLIIWKKKNKLFAIFLVFFTYNLFF